MELKFFSELQQSFEQETTRRDEIRMFVKELDKTSRQLGAQMSQIHANPKGPVPTIDYSIVQQHIKDLANLIPSHEFYRYNDLWSRVTQQLVFLVIFQSYLEQNEIVDNIIPSVESSLGVKVDIQNNLEEFHIPLEDILHGYISLVNELSRLAVNCVTVGDYQRPLVISKHVKDLSSGFQLLNLKNDSIRKRFDSIKYDLKKIEEVVYDITLRGLHNPKKRVLPDQDQDSLKKTKEEQ